MLVQVVTGPKVIKGMLKVCLHIQPKEFLFARNSMQGGARAATKVREPYGAPEILDNCTSVQDVAGTTIIMAMGKCVAKLVVQSKVVVVDLAKEVAKAGAEVEMKKMMKNM